MTIQANNNSETISSQIMLDGLSLMKTEKHSIQRDNIDYKLLESIEHRFLKLLFRLEKHIKKNSQFIIGEFALYDFSSRRVIPLPGVLNDNLTMDIGHRRETFFISSDTYKDIKNRMITDLMDKDLVFGKLIRGTIFEKEILVINWDHTRGNSQEIDGDNYINFIHKAKFLECVDEPKKEIFQTYFNTIQQLLEQDRNTHLRGDIHLIYIPSIFLTYEPPANFFGLYKIAEINKKKDAIVEEILQIYKGITAIYGQLIGILAEKRRIEVKEKSVKSAISAIMSRNVSHNLGSHVLAYLRTQLSDVQTLIKTGSLKEIIIDFNNLDGVIDLLNNIKENTEQREELIQKIELPFLVGLGHLLNYLQERQDFIATISTNHIPYSAPVNFKDIVYDELNHDFKAIRHHDSLGFKFNKGDNLLLEHIAHSEGYRRKHITIWFREFNGLNEANRKENLNNKYSIEVAKRAFNRLNEIDVILPGGAVGRQAFFSIIENFIRNSAKHANKISGDDPRLDVYIDLIDLADENEESMLETFSINSDEAIDMKDISTEGKIIDDSKMTEFFRVELSDNISDYENGKETLLKALKDDYILEDGSLKEDYKGIKEMRISATWLRFLNDEHILENENGNGDPTKKYPPVLQLAKKNNKICYVFYLLKPKELLFVTDNDNLLKKYGEEWKSEFEKIGWKITSFKDFDKNNDPRYRLIVFDCDEDNEDYQKLIKICHSRVIAVNCITNYILRNINHKDEIFNNYYGYIIKNIIKVKDIQNLTSEVPILINDSKVLTKLKHPQCHFLIKPASSKRSNIAAVLYRTHMETAANLEKFEKRYSKKLPTSTEDVETTKEAFLFAESITGNNSTDRLIRKSNYNERWYLNMLESALTNVIIIDERLWGYYSGIDESDLNQSTSIEFKSNKRKAAHPNNFKFLKYKNVWVFNIVKTDNQHALYDTKPDADPDNHYLPLKIAEINFDDNGVSLGKHNKKIKEIELPCKEYIHFICVHQGLIDKLYNSIKDDNSDKTIAKSSIINSIKDSLGGTNTRIIIHSGRSRPPKSDLPKEYTFLQYSAISHALKDCKHSLTELLYSART